MEQLLEQYMIIDSNENTDDTFHFDEEIEKETAQVLAYNDNDLLK